MQPTSTAAFNKEHHQSMKTEYSKARLVYKLGLHGNAGLGTSLMAIQSLKKFSLSCQHINQRSKNTYEHRQPAVQVR